MEYREKLIEAIKIKYGLEKPEDLKINGTELQDLSLHVLEYLLRV